MAYEPTEWKNREEEFPRRFTLQDNGDGTITLIPEPGQVTEPGTPIMAVNMNKIEEELFKHAEILDEETRYYDANSSDGLLYTVSIPNLTELNVGDKIRIIPKYGMNSGSVTIKINDLPNYPLYINNVTNLNRGLLRLNTRYTFYFAGENRFVLETPLVSLIDSYDNTAVIGAPTANALKSVYDMVKTTGWVDIPLGSGWRFNGSSQVAFLRYRKIGSVLQIVGKQIIADSGYSPVLAQLPTGATPQYTTSGLAEGSGPTSNITFAMLILSSGVIAPESARKTGLDTYTNGISFSIIIAI